MFLGKGIAMGSKDVYSHNVSYSNIWISSLVDDKEKSPL